MKSFKSILVVVTLRIGDVLLTTPLIRSLRQSWPDAKIDVLVFKGTEGVLMGNSDIHQILTVLPRPKFLPHFLFLLSLWRKYDLAISTMSSDRPSIYARIAGKYCVGEIEAGVKHEWKRKMLSNSIEPDIVGTHTVLNHLRMVDALGGARSYEVVAPSKAGDISSLHEKLSFDVEREPYVVLHTHAMYVYKAWHQDAWIELAWSLRKCGFRIILTGGSGAEELTSVQKLKQLMPEDTVELAGRLSFSELSYLLSKAHAYVGPDTVVTHLSAAIGIPTVALFGPSNPVKWGPWPKGYDKDEGPYRMVGTQHVGNVVLLQGGGECVPCMGEGCDRHINSLSRCLQELSVESVKAALSGLGLEMK